MNKLLLFIVSITALAAGLFFATQNNAPDLSDLSGFVFPNPETLSAVDLVNHNSEPLTETDFKDQWTFVYVGYTFCPDACPMTLTTLNQLTGILEEKGKLQASTLLVSVDPERDTPEHMKNYVTYFNEGFMAASGAPEAISHFADQVSASYSVPEDKSDPNYLVDHSSAIILINPDAAVHAIFTPPQDATVIAGDFERLVAHYKSR